MSSMEYINYRPSIVNPSWMKLERYEYCENDMLSKITLSERIHAIINKLFHK